MLSTEEEKVNKFHSPVPFLRNFQRFIFGKEKPDIYTRLTFNINMIIWLSFILWSILSFFTIKSRAIILQMKGIPVEKVIRERGVELGFKGEEFIDRLLTFNAIAIICWIIILIGLILLFRKIRQYIYFILGGALFYIGMSIFYLSYTYFMEDMTFYDKIALLVLITSSIFHFFLLKNEQEGGNINFFGETEEDE